MTEIIVRLVDFLKLDRSYVDRIKNEYEIFFGRDFFNDINPTSELPNSEINNDKKSDDVFIAICGFAGSGKSTVGNFLCENGFTELSFAKPLKDIVSWLHNLPRHLVEGDTNESRLWREEYKIKICEKIYTVRQLLQYTGTNIFRKIKNDIWIEILLKKLSGKCYIPDARFLNEISAIKNNGGKIIRVIRPMTDPKSFGDLHISETQHIEFNDWDFIIINDRDLSYLKKQIIKIIS